MQIGLSAQLSDLLITPLTWSCQSGFLRAVWLLRTLHSCTSTWPTMLKPLLCWAWWPHWWHVTVCHSACTKDKAPRRTSLALPATYIWYKYRMPWNQQGFIITLWKLVQWPYLYQRCSRQTNTGIYCTSSLSLLHHLLISYNISCIARLCVLCCKI